LKSVHAAAVAELAETQASSAKAARDALEQERQRVAAAVAAQEETQQALEALTRAHSALGEEVHSKHDELQNVATEHASAAQSLEETAAAHSAAVAELAQAKAEAQAAASAAAAKHAELEEKVAAIEDQCLQARTATEATEAAAEAETARFRASIDQLQRQCTEQEDEKRHRDGSLSAATAQLGKLEAQLLAEQQGRAALQQEVDQLTVDLTERERDRERLEELRAECQRLREEHSQLDATNGAAAAELAEVREAAEQRRVEGDREHAVALSALQDQLSAVSVSLREQTDATDAATAKLKEVSTKYHVLKSATDVAQAMDLAVRSTPTEASEEGDRVQLAQLRLEHAELEESYRVLVDEKARQLETSAAEREEERERCASLALASLPVISSYKSNKSLCGTGLCRLPPRTKRHSRH
jgi:hypothetical protein